MNEDETANIAQFLREMNDYSPPIPDSVIMHILAEAGMSTSDPRVHRTLNVACQKFINDVLEECSNIAKQRQKKEEGNKKQNKISLQVSDLKQALERFGIHVHRPDFIVSIPKKDNPE